MLAIAGIAIVSAGSLARSNNHAGSGSGSGCADLRGAGSGGAGSNDGAGIRGIVSVHIYHQSKIRPPVVLLLKSNHSRLYSWSYLR